jgi:dTDP-D-glucose 4,6-dehydratase
LDCSKIQRMVGWTPATARIEALRETVAWYAAYLEAR